MKGNFGNSNLLSLDCGRQRSCQLFLADIYNQAIREKLTFSKLQGRQEVALSLEKATKILSFKEATKCELHEKKKHSVTWQPEPKNGNDTEITEETYESKPLDLCML